MKKIERNFVETTGQNQPFVVRNTNSQASFNSDGVLTLRNYNPDNQQMDEIIIFSRRETEAIVQLMFAISQTMTDHKLPF